LTGFRKAGLLAIMSAVNRMVAERRA
jgi:hypothetical protein